MRLAMDTPLPLFAYRPSIFLFSYFPFPCQTINFRPWHSVHLSFSFPLFFASLSLSPFSWSDDWSWPFHYKPVIRETDIQSLSLEDTESQRQSPRPPLLPPLAPDLPLHAAQPVNHELSSGVAIPPQSLRERCSPRRMVFGVMWPSHLWAGLRSVGVTMVNIL